MQTRRSRQIERLGGIPDTGPTPYETDVTVLHPEDHPELDEPVEVEARTEIDEYGDAVSQQLTVLDPEDTDTEDRHRYAADRSDDLPLFEF